VNRKQRRAEAKERPATDLASAQRVFAQALTRHQAGRLGEAEALYRKAIRLAPGEPEIHYNLGLVLRQAERLDEAAREWRAAVEIRPGYVRALNNLGIVLAELDRPEEAEAYLRTALACADNTAESHNNLAIVLRDRGHQDEATIHCHRALALRPDYADAHNTLGIALYEKGCPDEAIAAYRRALEVSPGFAKAHFNLALALLLKGDLGRGWEEHEWRWKGGARHLQMRRDRQPEWQGRSPAGKTLLLYGEQGYGDALQFVRYATIAASMGARVMVEVPQPLVRIVGTVHGVADVVAAGRTPPPFDWHLPLMSVPRAVGTTLETIPAAVPYVRPEREAAAVWGRRLAGMAGLKVGLVWSGDPRPHDPAANAIDRRRSVALSRLVPLLTVPGVTFFSLQKGMPRRQIADLPADLRLLDFTDEIDDFADTAALLANLDLLITVDTAAAHLAGAMAKPVWILSRFDGCWRWLQNRDDSPWYPTARLFRQKAPADWDGVISEVRDRLVDLTVRTNYSKI
jgi:Flp pilus assembly protein TadD